MNLKQYSEATIVWDFIRVYWYLAILSEKEWKDIKIEIGDRHHGRTPSRKQK